MPRRKTVYLACPIGSGTVCGKLSLSILIVSQAAQTRPSNSSRLGRRQLPPSCSFAITMALATSSWFSLMILPSQRVPFHWRPTEQRIHSTPLRKSIIKCSRARNWPLASPVAIAAVGPNTKDAPQMILNIIRQNLCFFVQCRNVKASCCLTTKWCVTTNDHLLTLAHLTPIHRLVENYLIFFVFLPKTRAYSAWYRFCLLTRMSVTKTSNKRLVSYGYSILIGFLGASAWSWRWFQVVALRHSSTFRLSWLFLAALFLRSCTRACLLSWEALGDG